MTEGRPPRPRKARGRGRRAERGASGKHGVRHSAWSRTASHALAGTKGEDEGRMRAAS